MFVKGALSPAPTPSIARTHISRTVPVGTFQTGYGQVTPCAHLKSYRDCDPNKIVALLGAQAFSKRQAEVTALLWSGMSQKQIADELNISRDTVAHHLDAAYQRTKARGAVALTRWVSALVHIADAQS